MLKEARAEAKAIMIKSAAESKAMRENSLAWADILKAAMTLVQESSKVAPTAVEDNPVINTQSQIMMKLGLFPEGLKAVLESTRDFWTCLVWLPLLVLLASTDILL